MTVESEPARTAYRERLASRRDELLLVRRRARFLGNLRIALVFGTLFCVLFPLWSRHGAVWWALAPIAIAFIILGKMHDRTRDREAGLMGAIRFLEAGLSRLDERWRADDGHADHELEAAFRARVHYADDLDLFGSASLFRLIDRSATSSGRTTVARWLTEVASKDDIVLRQHAIRELAPRFDLREAIVMAGSASEEGALDDRALLAWAGAVDPIPFRRLLHTVGIALPVGFAVAAALAYFDGPRLPLGVVLVLYTVLLFLTRNLVARRIAVLAGPDRGLERHARLIHAIETADVSSDALVALRARLRGRTDDESASAAIRSLHRIVELLDTRLNLVFAATLGPLLLWNLNFVLRADRWRCVYGPRLGAWIATIGEFEALSSFAALLFERPDYTMPTFIDGEARIVALGLAHPLVDRRVVVGNDLALEGPGSVVLLSGSNMSGKSTLLRAIGVNVVLAQCGAPVAARSLTLTPMALGTSVRILDSLASGTSHFMAEIERLRALVDLSRSSSVPLLFLLDEILHGTNSRERLIGARSVVRTLSRAGAIGIVTTHDLSLASIEGALATGKFSAMHLGDEVAEGGMRFHYTLRPGPVTSTNALRLMRSIGIEVDDGG